MLYEKKMIAGGRGHGGTSEDKRTKDEGKYSLIEINTKAKEINATTILHQRLWNQAAIQKVISIGIRKNPAS
jgi:hypothetical protein